MSALYIFCQNEVNIKHLCIYTRISALCKIQTWQITSEIAQFLPGTNATKQRNDFLAMAENDLLDFKANWREFCYHFYFRDLTSNQRRLGK